MKVEIVVPVPLDLLDRIIPALLGANIVYQKQADHPAFSYLTKAIADEFETDVESLLTLMKDAGWTPPISPEIDGEGES